MQTDMTKLIVVFRIANASKKEKKSTLYGQNAEFINSLAAGTQSTHDVYEVKLRKGQA